MTEDAIQEPAPTNVLELGVAGPSPRCSSTKNVIEVEVKDPKKLKSDILSGLSFSIFALVKSPETIQACLIKI